MPSTTISPTSPARSPMANLTRLPASQKVHLVDEWTWTEAPKTQNSTEQTLVHGGAGTPTSPPAGQCNALPSAFSYLKLPLSLSTGNSDTTSSLKPELGEKEESGVESEASEASTLPAACLNGEGRPALDISCLVGIGSSFIPDGNDIPVPRTWNFWA